MERLWPAAEGNNVSRDSLGIPKMKGPKCELEHVKGDDEERRNMESRNIDELYHQLRLVSLDDPETQRAIRSLCNHLTGYSYEGLLEYSHWYGEKYTLPSVIKVLEAWRDPIRERKYTRVVDLGAGSGWLGLGLSRYLDVPVIGVDKREWAGITFKVDLERTSGLTQLTMILRPDDLLVMCDFLHCLDRPSLILKVLNPWDMLILEYGGLAKTAHTNSYTQQIKKYGANPISWEQIYSILVDLRRGDLVCEALDTYNLILSLKGGTC